MQRTFLGIVCALAFAASAHAADLENCQKFPEYQQKTDCLFKNEVLVNSTLEVTIGELRKSVAELQSTVTQLKIDVKALKDSAPDISNVVRVGSKIQLESTVHNGTCLDHDTHDAGHIQGWGCNSGQAWKINAR